MSLSQRSDFTFRLRGQQSYEKIMKIIIWRKKLDSEIGLVVFRAFCILDPPLKSVHRLVEPQKMFFAIKN